MDDDLAPRVVVCKYMGIDGGHIQGIYGPWPGHDAALEARAWLRQLPGMSETWEWEIWPLTMISVAGALPGDLQRDGERGTAKPVSQLPAGGAP